MKSDKGPHNVTLWSLHTHMVTCSHTYKHACVCVHKYTHRRHTSNMFLTALGPGKSTLFFIFIFSHFLYTYKGRERGLIPPWGFHLMTSSLARGVTFEYRHVKVRVSTHECWRDTNIRSITWPSIQWWVRRGGNSNNVEENKKCKIVPSLEKESFALKKTKNKQTLWSTLLVGKVPHFPC